MIKDDVK